MNTHVFESPIGRIRLEADAGALRSVDLGVHEPLDRTDDPVLREAAEQLRAWFAGERRTFDLPLHSGGTPFQRKVWAALLEIPYGETRSYAEIAVAIGRPTATRAVGAANGRNPLAIVVPCHRVIGADGSLTGYAGGLDLKRWLLAHEGARVGPEQLSVFGR